LSIRAIAAREGVPSRTIYDALIHYRIPRRPAGFHSKRFQPIDAPLDETTLRHLYLHEERTIRDIAALYLVSTRKVYDALRRYRIPRRTSRQQKLPPEVVTFGDGMLDKVRLQRLYEQEDQSIATIAATLGCSPSSIRNALIRWGIARRRRGRRSRADASG
jgi:transposase-like protein